MSNSSVKKLLPWGPAQTGAIKQLKVIAQSPPPLRIPTSGQHILQTDASDNQYKPQKLHLTDDQMVKSNCLMFSSHSYEESFPPLEKQTDTQTRVTSKPFVQSPITASGQPEEPKPKMPMLKIILFNNSVRKLTVLPLRILVSHSRGMSLSNSCFGISSQDIPEPLKKDKGPMDQYHYRTVQNQSSDSSEPETVDESNPSESNPSSSNSRMRYKQCIIKGYENCNPLPFLFPS